MDSQGPVQGTAGPGDEFSTATHRVLGWYDAVQSVNEDAPPPSALWTAVVLDAEAFPSQTLAALVPEHLERAPRPAQNDALQDGVGPRASRRGDWFGIQAASARAEPLSRMRNVSRH